MKKTKSKRAICKRGGRGRGLLNSLINKLPYELHIPGYRFCGPGTKLTKRLERGDVGINPLDEACKQHDIAYHNYQDLERRHAADLVLLEKAIERLHASDASFGEKSAAAIVKNIMAIKRKMGAGVKKKKKGGFLFPLLATALTAFKTYKDFKNAKKMLANQEAHNKTMEEIARKGKGLYLRPYQGEGAKKNVDEEEDERSYDRRAAQIYGSKYFKFPRSLHDRSVTQKASLSRKCNS